MGVVEAPHLVVVLPPGEADMPTQRALGCEALELGMQRPVPDDGQLRRQAVLARQRDGFAGKADTLLLDQPADAEDAKGSSLRAE